MSNKTLKLNQLISDPQNANKGTERGKLALAQSLKDYGAARAIVLDKNNCIIAGNKTVEQASLLENLDNVIVIETTGDQLVAVKRIDLDLSQDIKAQELAIADNFVSQIDLDWNPDILESKKETLELTKFWTKAELPKLLNSISLDTENDNHKSANIKEQFMIVIICNSESEQIDLLNRFNEEGLKCRALIS